MTARVPGPAADRLRPLVWLWAIATVLIVGLLLIEPIQRLIATIVGDRVPLTLSTDPTRTPMIGRVTGGLTDLQIRTASLLTNALSGGPRSLLAASAGIEALTILVCGVAAIALCVMFAQHRVFAPAARRTLILAAVTLFAGVTTANILAGLGRGQATSELAPFLEPGATMYGMPDAAVDIPLLPIGVAFGFAVLLVLLSRLLHVGARLRHDTEGLV